MRPVKGLSNLCPTSWLPCGGSKREVSNGVLGQAGVSADRCYGVDPARLGAPVRGGGTGALGRRLPVVRRRTGRGAEGDGRAGQQRGTGVTGREDGARDVGSGTPRDPSRPWRDPGPGVRGGGAQPLSLIHI